jgi:hypothetical protein
MSTARRLARVGARALVLAPAAGAIAAPAFAQTAGGSSQPDLVPVALWTFAIACIAMLVLSLGYLYRRARGAQDEVIPKSVDPYYATVGYLEEHSTGELHPEMQGPPHEEHESAGHAT